MGGVLQAIRPLSTTTPTATPALSQLAIERIARTGRDWKENPRWRGITRCYTPEDVERIRGSVDIEYTLAKRGADRLWSLLHKRPFIRSLGAVTGNQVRKLIRKS